MSVDLLDPTRAASSPHALMAGGELRALLHRAVPELATGLWSLREAQALMPLPRGSQRFTSCLVTWDDHGRGSTDCAELVLKEDRKRTPRWADRAARLLVGAGFGPGSQSQVAAPYGVCGPGVLVSERVGGLSLLSTLLSAPTPTAAAVVAERAATWLLDLQGVPLDLPTSDRRGLGAALPQLVELAAVLSPERGRELGELARRLQEAHGAKQGDVVTSHGDLHPANLFLTGDAVVAIDLDTVAAREPAYDVGYAVSHLVVTSLLAGAPPEHGVAAAARLWDAYRRGGGVATEHRVAVQAARALVQSLHFELVTYRTGRVELAPQWVGAALALLEQGRAGLDALPELLAPLVTSTDQAVAV